MQIPAGEGAENVVTSATATCSFGEVVDCATSAAKISYV